MHFTILLSLQVLMVAPLVMAKELSLKEEQERICGDEKDTSEMVMECVGKQDLEPYKDAMMECYSGMEGVSKEELKDYHCSHSPEELEEGDKCLNQKMKDEGKCEEVQKIMADIRNCIEAGEGKRK
ncbi:hypothetical protein AVEN_48678-1 [Araneus ventricosus]|uniref:DUF19 domain-containing protein n=1 Tax=Araneus ventricosus TaxID=182803 RepID=A0A4Y2FYD8_ARAVE|nr:hypothetical protein AVEN_48678-1 [Araneus ventricosus]